MKIKNAWFIILLIICATSQSSSLDDSLREVLGAELTLIKQRLESSHNPPQMSSLMRYYLDAFERTGKNVSYKQCIRNNSRDYYSRLININCVYTAISRDEQDWAFDDAIVAASELRDLLLKADPYDPELRNIVLKLAELKFRVDYKNFQVDDELVAEDGHVSLFIDGELRDFDVDIGAEYSALIDRPFDGVYADSVHVRTDSPTRKDLMIDLRVGVERSGRYFIYFHPYQKNVLGRSFLKNYRRVVLHSSFSMNLAPSISTRMYQDGGYIFVSGEVQYGGINKDVNVCFDNGASMTYATQRLFLKLRPAPNDLTNRQQIVLSSLGSVEKYFSAVVRGTNVLVEGRRVLSNVRFLFYSNPSSVCDIVLGRDEIERRTLSINFSDRRVTFF